MLIRLLLLIAAATLTACGHPSLGDREAALTYLKNYQRGAAGKPIMHEIGYHAHWCAEGDTEYWPQAVKYCNPAEGESPNNLCAFVNLAEASRLRGNRDCDPGAGLNSLRSKSVDHG